MHRGPLRARDLLQHLAGEVVRGSGTRRRHQERRVAGLGQGEEAFTSSALMDGFTCNTSGVMEIVLMGSKSFDQ